MANCRLVQVGVTALRDPITREPLPAVPLYVLSKDALQLSGLTSAEEATATDFAGLCVKKMKEYKAAEAAAKREIKKGKKATGGIGC